MLRARTALEGSAAICADPRHTVWRVYGELLTMKMIDLTPRIGTEIRTDVETLLSGELSGKIRALLEQRGVVAIREINLTDEQQVDFTRTLGNIIDAGQGSITKITIDPTENYNAGHLASSFFLQVRC